MNILRRFFLRWTDPIVIVSGLPRSGTSMAMKMLEAGGIEPFTDELREADEDNPKGYYEFEPVKDLHEQDDKSWLKQARGKALKVISYLLKSLPPEHRYQVIFMNRHPDEVMASQNKMLERRGETLDQDSAAMKEAFENQLWRSRYWLKRQKHFTVLEVDYAEVLNAPRREAERIAAFLDRPLDLDKMASVVDPNLYRNRAPD